MFAVDEKFIMAVAPKFSGNSAAAQKRIVGAISPVFASTLDSYDINSRLRIAHFMGQVTHECAGFRTTVNGGVKTGQAAAQKSATLARA